MSLADLLNRFNILLLYKSSLYDEASYNSFTNDKVENYSLSKVICELNEKKHNFTQKNFDAFVKLACFKKSRSYILNESYTPYSYSSTANSTKVKNNDYRIKCIDIMFTLFNPTSKQLTTLLNCYDGYKKRFEWVDALIKKKFTFNDSQILKLQQAGYSINNLVADKKMDIDTFNKFMLNYKDDQADADKTVINIVEKNNIVPNNTSMMNFLSSSNKSVDHLNAILKYFVSKGLEVTDEITNMIIIKELFNEKVLEFLVSIGRSPSKKSVHEFIKKQPSYYFRVDLLLYIYEKCIVPDISDLNCILSYYNKNHFAKDIKYPLENINKCCKKNISSTYNLNFVEYNTINITIDNNSYFDLALYFLSKGVIPDQTSLNISCKTKNSFMFNILIKKYKITPNNDTLSQCLFGSTVNKEMLVEILNYKVTPDFNNFKALLDSSLHVGLDEIIEILINAGLYITYDMIDYALSKRYLIKNLERFSIPYDEKLYWYCYKNNCSGYTFNDIDHHVIYMRNFAGQCSFSDSTKIINYAVEHNLKIDRYVLDYSIRRNTKLGNILLDEFNCDPTIGCLLMNNNVNNTSINIFKKLLNIHNIDQEYMMETLDLDLKGYLNKLT